MIPSEPPRPEKFATSPAGDELTSVSRSLHGEFDARLGSATVDTAIHRAADRFTGAKIRAYVPLFVQRYAGHELDEQQTLLDGAPPASDQDAPGGEPKSA